MFGENYDLSEKLRTENKAQHEWKQDAKRQRNKIIVKRKRIREKNTEIKEKERYFFMQVNSSCLARHYVTVWETIRTKGCASEEAVLWWYLRRWFSFLS